MIDLKAIAKDAAERVHKNGGCVPQMAFAPILFALQDALSTTPARAEAQHEGAEREAVARTMLRDAFIAGRVVSTATTGSQDQRDAEAYAAERDLSSLSTTPARAEAQDEGAAGEPVAKVVRKGFSTGSISWTKFGQDADLSDETPLYAHPSPTPAADADRVREAAIVAKNMADNASFNLNQAGLTTETATCDRAFLDIYRTLEAALKSTAAKEGSG